MDLTRSYDIVFPPKIIDRYELRETRDAAAVIKSTNPNEFDEITSVLSKFALTDADILTPGGGLALELGRDAFGTTTTTNLEKLEPRLTRGDAGGCPVLAVAITRRCRA